MPKIERFEARLDLQPKNSITEIETSLLMRFEEDPTVEIKPPLNRDLMEEALRFWHFKESDPEKFELLLAMTDHKGYTVFVRKERYPEYPTHIVRKVS